MSPTAIRQSALAGAAAIALSMGTTACTTPAVSNSAPGIVVDGNQYVTLDAPVGSHMKRRVKIVDIKQPGISPTRTDIVTAETDTTMFPPTAAEMERATRN